MADIDFYQDDSDESQDDADLLGLLYSGGEDINLNDYGELANPDEGLTPLQKLDKYIDSENIFSRQMVARSLLDTLRAVSHNEEDAITVLKAMARLSEDQGSNSYEASVRAEVMEQVPHLAMCCHQNKLLTLDTVPTYILPTVTHCLMDCNNQVRKTSQAALLVLLEQELVDKSDVEEQVCPVILDLSSTDSIDDFRTEAVALMSKMAPFVGQDITTRIFLPRFVAMCTDALFHVRKVCAANFGDMCSVVGQHHTEQYLLPKFFYLCEDGVWGVRKACAECFMAVSIAASVEVRRRDLASLFISLICDQSRWVRMAAFQALGGFISTFADPNSTGLYVNEEGILQALVDATRDAQQDDSSEEEAESSSNNPDSETSNCLSNNQLIDQSQNLQQNTEQPSSEESSEQSEETAEEQGLQAAMEIDEENDVFDESTETYLSTQSQESLEEKLAHKYEHLESRTLLNGDSDSLGNSESRKLGSQLGENNLDNNNKGPSVDDKSAKPMQSSSSTDDQDNNNKQGRSDTQTGAGASTGGEAAATPGGESGKLSDDQAFNSFHYWRDPLPAVDIELDLCETGSPGPQTFTAESETSSSPERSHQRSLLQVAEQLAELNDDSSSDDEEDAIKIHTASVSMVTDTTETVANIGSTHVLGHQLNETTMSVVNGVLQDYGNNTKMFGGYNKQRCGGTSELEAAERGLEAFHCDQDVIPQALLEHYLSMIDPTRAQTVDTEIARHCAYSLPAVAFTLGRRYWPCLKELYETLAADMQWKVRRTLAFSIHELAQILGEDLTNKDLVPVFNGFLKDLDEVRIGVLKRLADFLRLLSPEMRHEYLNKIADFLVTDNSRNWRFREELAQQLILVTELYSPEEISEHLVPIAISLAEDRVSEVRLTAFRVISAMLRRLSMATNSQASSNLINEIIQRFALSGKWIRRQTYAHLCRHILDDCCVNLERFAHDFLPSLITLGNDPIPNVRISLAKSLAENVIHIDYFQSEQNPYYEDLIRINNKLRSDTDRDVRHFISRTPAAMSHLHENVPECGEELA